MRNKRVLILIGGFLLLIFGILTMRGGGDNAAVPSSPAAPYLSVLPASPDGGGASAALGQDLLAALALLKTIRLDTSIFSDGVFASLSDWGKTITPQPVGRRNPFAPLGASTAKKPIAPAKSTVSATAATSSSPSSPDADVWDFSNIDFSF